MKKIKFYAFTTAAALTASAVLPQALQASAEDSFTVKSVVVAPQAETGVSSERLTDGTIVTAYRSDTTDESSPYYGRIYSKVYIMPTEEGYTYQTYEYDNYALHVTVTDEAAFLRETDGQYYTMKYDDGSYFVADAGTELMSTEEEAVPRFKPKNYWDEEKARTELTSLTALDCVEAGSLMQGYSKLDKWLLGPYAIEAYTTKAISDEALTALCPEGVTAHATDTNGIRLEYVDEAARQKLAPDDSGNSLLVSDWGITYQFISALYDLEGVYAVNLDFAYYAAIYTGLSFEDEPAFSAGDADGDGTVTIYDAYQVLMYHSNHAVGNKSYAFQIDAAAENSVLSAVDVDGNGKIDMQDAYFILLYSSYQYAGTPVSWEELCRS